jgi:ribonucleoside-diphosphate reductase beta chain
MPEHRRFRSLQPGGIVPDSPTMRLWDKAKRLGTWNPADIDFEPDRDHWLGLEADEQELLLRLTALFAGGEESVTLDLLPLIGVIADEGRLDEEMYLTSFLWEEAKHVEAFRRFLDEVVVDWPDLAVYQTAGYRQIFGVALPEAMSALKHDSSPVAQARASTTYNMIVEGVLAETGYHVYHEMLERRDIMPGMREVVAHLKNDESRHLAYGVYLLSRLVAEHGDPVWETIQTTMGALLDPALGVVREVFADYEGREVPFGLEADAFLGFATDQFQRRLQRLMLAREQSVEQVYAMEVTTSGS